MAAEASQLGPVFPLGCSDDALAVILSYLCPRAIASLRRVSKAFQRVLTRPSGPIWGVLWRTAQEIMNPQSVSMVAEDTTAAAEEEDTSNSGAVFGALRQYYLFWAWARACTHVSFVTPIEDAAQLNRYPTLFRNPLSEEQTGVIIANRLCRVRSLGSVSGTSNELLMMAPDTRQFPRVTFFADIGRNNAVSSGSWNIGVRLGRNVICFHPGMQGGEYRVEGPGGWGNRTSPDSNGQNRPIPFHMYRFRVTLDRPANEVTFSVRALPGLVHNPIESPYWAVASDPHADALCSCPEGRLLAEFSYNPEIAFTEDGSMQSPVFGIRQEGYPRPPTAELYCARLAAVPGVWDFLPFELFV